MKFKKVVSLLAASIMVVSLTACGSKGVSTNSNGKDGNFNGEKLTVGIWGGNDSETAAINKVKADFEKKTGAKVEFKVYTDYNTQIQADFVGKTAPDVFYVDANAFPFFESLGVLDKLDNKEMQSDKFYENLSKAFKEGSDLYAVPKDLSTLATYVNTDLLTSVGMTMNDIPKDLEGYKDFLPKLQAKLDEKYGKGKITAMTWNEDLARNLHLLERDGVVTKDNKSTLASDGIVKNLQYLVEMAKTGAMKTPKEIGLGWNGEVFGAGKAVIMEEGNWVYAVLKDQFKNIKFEVKDMPTYKGKASSMAFTVGYGVYSQSKEKDLAKEWIKYATGTEGMKTWCTGAGTLPSREDVSTSMNIKSDKVLKTHLDQVQYARPWQEGKSILTINGAYQNFLPSAVKGEITVKEAMEKADKQANTEISNSN